MVSSALPWLSAKPSAAILRNQAADIHPPAGQCREISDGQNRRAVDRSVLQHAVPFDLQLGTAATINLTDNDHLMRETGLVAAAVPFGLTRRRQQDRHEGGTERLHESTVLNDTTR
jgi:hypothetical protein